MSLLRDLVGLDEVLIFLDPGLGAAHFQGVVLGQGVDQFLDLRGEVDQVVAVETVEERLGGVHGLAVDGVFHRICDRLDDPADRRQKRLLEDGPRNALVVVGIEPEGHGVGLDDLEGPLLAVLDAGKVHGVALELHRAELPHPIDEASGPIAVLAAEGFEEQATHQGRVAVLFGVKQALNRVVVDELVHRGEIGADHVLTRLDLVLGQERQSDNGSAFNDSFLHGERFPLGSGLQR